MKVYKAISEVSGEMLAGIAKDRKNQQQGFMFRGIDAVYNALAPALVKHGLLILPRITSRTVTERATKSGGALFYVVVEAEFDFVSTEDGSKHTVKTYGEAMDSGDKATNKAMSIAYKYAAFQAFCIPTEDTAIDADATAHNVASQPRNNQPQSAQQQSKQPLDTLEGQTLNAVAQWLSEGLTVEHVAERLGSKYILHPAVMQKIKSMSEGK